MELNEFSLQATPPTGSCENLPNTAEYRLINPCAGTVNYPFFLPAGRSLKQLEINARSALNSTVLLAVGDSCGQSIISMVCAGIYLRCHAGVDFTNTSTYNTHIYSINSPGFATPVDRPCLSVCNLARSRCSSTLYSLSPGLPTCTNRFDFSFGDPPNATFPSLYESSSDPQLCFTPSLTPVARQLEPYKHRNDGSFCSGFADNTFISSGTAMNASYTATQPPFTFQDSVHEMLEDGVSALPVFIDADCMQVLRKVLCSTSLMKPVPVSLLSALQYSNLPTAIMQLNASATTRPLLASVVYVPSFPHISLCESYYTTCARFIASVNTTRAAILAPNCTGMVRNRPGVRQFPEAAQTLASVTTGLGVIKFASNPTTDVYFNASEYHYETQCPKGFVVPEDPTHEDTMYIGGTGCSTSCR